MVSSITDGLFFTPPRASPRIVLCKLNPTHIFILFCIHHQALITARMKNQTETSRWKIWLRWHCRLVMACCSHFLISSWSLSSSSLSSSLPWEAWMFNLLPPKKQDQSVSHCIGGHWRSLEVIGGRLRSLDVIGGNWRSNQINPRPV